MTNRMNHTDCLHDATPAGRRACRNRTRTVTQVVAPVIVSTETIDTEVGKVRAGSIILAEVRGGRPERYTVLEVSQDIKNEYPGWEADGRWGYADQVLRVIKF